MARMFGGAVFFQCALRLLRPRSKPTRLEHLRLAGLSLRGVVLNQGLFLVGLSITTAFSAALLTAVIPVFTAVIAVVLRQERATLWMAGGLALAVSGVLWLTGLHSIDRGALIVTANCLAYSLYLVLARPMIRRLGPLVVISWVYAYGMLIFSPIGMFAVARDLPAWSSQSWLLVGVMVIGPTIFAYGANAWALARATPSVVAVFIYLQPLFAALLAWVQLGQGLTVRMMVATVLIFAGVGLVLAPASLRARAKG
jgi:drug/metabolite transporter (DMT)-like permease